MLNVLDLQKMKQEKDKIVMITAYDYPSAKQAENAGIDLILVGDSLGMVVLGYSTTVKVTMEDMIHHTKAVKRGASKTFTVVDMPFMSYHVSNEITLNNAKRLFQDTGAQAIKMEGASKHILNAIERLTTGGIPVMGHLGLTPQTVNVLGGFKVQGRDLEEAERLLQEAKRLEESGAIAIVLECVPKELAKIITDQINIPTIGIGAGNDCDGQVLVYHDVLQYGVVRLPKFVKPYANLNNINEEALKVYIKEVKESAFPTDAYSFHMKNKEYLPDVKGK